MARKYTQLILLAFLLTFVTATPISGEADIGHLSEDHFQHLSQRTSDSTYKLGAKPTEAELSAAVGSVPNKSWFWTGRRGTCASETDGVMSFAESLAAKNQGSTLEMRIEQAKALKMPPPRTGVEAKAAWRYISGAFARQAAGNAFVVLGKCVRPTNTWDTTEFPNLKANKAMKCVYKFGTEDGWKSPQFLWAAAGQEANCQKNLKTGGKALFG